MELKTHRDNSTLTFSLSGRLDTTTSPSLAAKLDELLTDDIDALVFDFEGLEYMSSAGIRVILTADKKMDGKGSMKLIHVSDEIREIFDMTGLADFLTIE